MGLRDGEFTEQLPSRTSEPLNLHFNIYRFHHAQWWNIRGRGRENSCASCGASTVSAAQTTWGTGSVKLLFHGSGWDIKPSKLQQRENPPEITGFDAASLPPASDNHPLALIRKEFRGAGLNRSPATLGHYTICVSVCMAASIKFYRPVITRSHMDRHSCLTWHHVKKVGMEPFRSQNKYLSFKLKVQR